MRTIYYLTLSVQRGQEPAVLLDIEFPDVPTLNAMLTEVHEADLSAYILATSGERDVKFSHKMLGDTLAAEFRVAARSAKPMESLKHLGIAVEESEKAAPSLRECISDVVDHIVNQEHERKVERHMTVVTVVVVAAGVLAFAALGVYLWSTK